MLVLRREIREESDGMKRLRAVLSTPKGVVLALEEVGQQRHVLASVLDVVPSARGLAVPCALGPGT